MASGEARSLAPDDRPEGESDPGGLSTRRDAGLSRTTPIPAAGRLNLVRAEEEETDARRNEFLARFVAAERRIFAYIFTLLPHRADAEDILQAVSLVMWQKFDEHSVPEDFVAWGCRIAHFRILDYRKSKRRQRVLFSESLMEQLAGTMADEAMARNLEDRREALARCLEKLRRPDRDLLTLRLGEGSTTRSTADGLGRSVDAVYKALQRIRRGLFDCVSRSLAEGGRR